MGALDRIYYRIERAIVVASMGAMALMVTLDVIYRRLHGEHGWATRAGIAVAAYAVLLFAARTVKVKAAPLVALGLLAALFGLTRLMLLAPSKWTYVALWALGAAGVASGAGGRARAALALASIPVVAFLLKFVPEGFSWAKEVSLILLLWVGFFGASMATHDRRHITIDFIRKLVPEARRNAYECASHLLSAGFAGFLAYLSWLYVFGSDGGLYVLGGSFHHSDVPLWAGIAAVPLGFATMTLRFAGHAIAAARGHLKPAGETHR